MVVHTVWCSTLELYHGCTYSMVQYTGVIPWLYIQYGAVHWSYTMVVHTVWYSTLELYHGCTYSMVQYTQLKVTLRYLNVTFNCTYLI